VGEDEKRDAVMRVFAFTKGCQEGGILKLEIAIIR